MDLSLQGNAPASLADHAGEPATNTASPAAQHAASSEPTAAAEPATEPGAEPFNELDAALREVLPKGFTYFQDAETAVHGRREVKVSKAIWADPGGVWELWAYHCVASGRYGFRVQGPDTTVQRDHLSAAEILAMLDTLGVLPKTR